jgi:acetyltransferase-like isoleucine patch superfamily enzyme
MRGTFYIVFYRIKNNNIKISFPFYTNAPVRIYGPGTVIIGKSSRVILNMFKGLTIVTYSADSVVSIGEKCSLGGLTVRCTGKISLGDKVMTGFSLLQDSCCKDKTGHNDIYVGSNAWIGGECIILGGCTIGEDSVLSFGTCCHGMEVGNYKLISGNPANRPLPIDKILQLTRMK